MTSKTWRQRWLKPLARLLRGEKGSGPRASRRRRILLTLEELESRLTPSSASLQFNTGSETVNASAGTFSIPVTLTGAVAPIVTSFIANFNQPNAEAFDAAGNLYVANGNDGTINKVTPAGAVTTFVSGFGTPDGLAFDAAGNLYVADGKANTVSKVTPVGVVTTFATGFSVPDALAFDAAGNLYVGNNGNIITNMVNKVTTAGVVSTFATVSGSPTGLAFDAAGNLYVANGGGIVSKVTTAGAVSTFASGFSVAQGLAFDAAGNLYVANHGSGNLSKVTPAGAVSTFASGITGANGLAIDSASNLYVASDLVGTVSKVTAAGTVSIFASSPLSGPKAEAFDAAGNLYIPNTGNGTVIKVTPAGVVSTFASGFSLPECIAIDAAGNIYVGERNGTTVKKVTPAGVVSVFASGFDVPDGLAFDAAGNLYVANNFANTVSKVTPGGVVSTFTSSVFQPDGLAFDAAGNLYVADGTGTGGVTKVTPAGVASTFASGFAIPEGLAFDAAGNLYVADSYNNTLSKVTPAGVVSTVASGLNAPNSLAIDAAGNLFFTHLTNSVSEITSTVTVPYTLGGTAVAGTDYSGVTNGTLTFPTGQTTENITGTLIDDPGGNKTLTFTLGTPSSNAVLGSLAVNSLTINETAANNPVPTLTSISPASVLAGSSQTTITLTGSSFVNGSTADLNGTPLATTFVSATQLTAVIPASDLTAGGSDSITVVTGGPGGGTSAPQTFTVNTSPTVQFTTGNETINQSVGAFSIPVTYTGALPPRTTTTFASGFLSTSQLAFDAAGNLFVANEGDNTVNEVTPAGVVSTFATGFVSPVGLAFHAGNLYVSNEDSGVVNEVTPAGVVSIFATGFSEPESLAFDAAGNLYVTNLGANTVSKVTPAGVVTTFAAGFNGAWGSAFDTGGNLYVSNLFANTVSKVTPAGVITTFASGIIQPTGMAFDAAGNLFVVSTSAGAVDEVTPAGVVSTFATGFSSPEGIAIDAAGNLYVSNVATVSKVSGAVTVPFTLGGTAVSGTDYSGVTAGTLTFGNGQTTENITGTLLADLGANKTLTFTLGTPTNVALGSPATNTLTIDESNPAPTLTSITPASATVGDNATTITLTGSSFVIGSTAYFNGAALTTTFVSATQLTAVIPTADLAAVGTDSISVVTGGPGGGGSSPQTFTVKPSATVQFSTGAETINESAGTFSIPVTLTGAVLPTITTIAAVSVNEPTNVAFDDAGNLYVANEGNNTISKMTPAGVVSTFASGFKQPIGLAFDAAGNLYVANFGANSVSKVTPAGVVSTFASGFREPEGLAFDTAGNLFVANFAGTTVSEVTPAGVVSTFASGFNGPIGLAFDAAGNLYVANFGANSVSKVTPAGVVSTFASGFNTPTGLAFDDAGNLYVANNGANKVSEVTPAGLVSTFASRLAQPYGLAFDAAGDLYVASPDGDFSTVSEVSTTVTVPFTLSGTAVSGTDYSGVTTSPLVFAHGQTTENITGTLLYDVGPSQTLTFTLGTPSSNVGLGGPLTNTLTIDEPNPNPVPTLTSINPASATVGDPDTTITLVGTGFINGSTADFNSAPIATMFVSATQLTAVISAADLTTVGTYPITVVTSLPGGGTSSPQTFSVNAVTNPAPTLTSITPNSATAGSPDVTITLTGSSFVNSSTANFNGAPVATTFLSATQLTAVIPSADLTTAGGYMITVVTAGPGGGASTAQTFTVNAVNAGSTSTTAANVSAFFNSAAQTVALSATVTSTAGTVNEGTATFTILNGATVVGSPLTVKVVSGAAHANYTLPAGLPLGSYTIRAVYNGDANFLTSSDASHTLTVSASTGGTAVPVNTVVLLTNGSLIEYIPGQTSPVLLSNHDTIRAVSTVLDVRGQTDIFAISESTTPTGLVGAQYNNNLWEYIFGSWHQQSSGAFKQISGTTNSGGETIVFGLLTNGSLWEQTHSFGVDTGWSELSGNGTIKYVSAVTDASGNDHVYVIDTPQVGEKYANTLWEHIPTGWRQDSSGQFSSISAGLNSAGQAVVYGILTNGQLWEQNPAFGPIGLDSGFHELSGANGLTDANGTPILFTSVQAAGPDEVFGIAQDQNTWKHTLTGKVATNTELTHGLLASQLSATETLSGVDEAFETLIDGSFWEYSSAFPGNHYKELLTGGVASSSTPA